MVSTMSAGLFAKAAPQSGGFTRIQASLAQSEAAEGGLRSPVELQRRRHRRASRGLPSCPSCGHDPRRRAAPAAIGNRQSVRMAAERRRQIPDDVDIDGLQRGHLRQGAVDDRRRRRRGHLLRRRRIRPEPDHDDHLRAGRHPGLPGPARSERGLGALSDRPVPVAEPGARARLRRLPGDLRHPAGHRQHRERASHGHQRLRLSVLREEPLPGRLVAFPSSCRRTIRSPTAHSTAPTCPIGSTR